MHIINAGIPTEILCDQHLIVEHRTIILIPQNVLYRLKKHIPFNGLPQEFTLGACNVPFFYDKLTYIDNRFYQIRTELIQRGYHCADNNNLIGIPEHLKNDYTQTEFNIELLRQRIIEHMPQLPRYHKKPVDRDVFISEFNTKLREHQLINKKT